MYRILDMAVATECNKFFKGNNLNALIAFMAETGAESGDRKRIFTRPEFMPLQMANAGYGGSRSLGRNDAFDAVPKAKEQGLIICKGNLDDGFTYELTDKGLEYFESDIASQLAFIRRTAEEKKQKYEDINTAQGHRISHCFSDNDPPGLLNVEAGYQTDSLSQNFWRDFLNKHAVAKDIHPDDQGKNISPSRN